MKTNISPTAYADLAPPIHEININPAECLKLALTVPELLLSIQQIQI
jgi:hypothetical protein